MSGKIRVATLAIAATIALSGLATAQDYYRFYDRDYGYRHYDRDDYGYNRTAFRVARDFGYEDGSWVARRDIAEAKPYNPFPRGGFKHEDHGYRREYGDKVCLQGSVCARLSRRLRTSISTILVFRP